MFIYYSNGVRYHVVPVTITTSVGTLHFSEVVFGRTKYHVHQPNFTTEFTIIISGESPVNFSWAIIAVTHI